MGLVRILLAMSSDTSIGKLSVILSEGGYTVIDQAKDGNECLIKIRTLRPDVAIIDYNLSLMNGYEVSKVIIEEKLCDIILVTTPAQEVLVGDIREENNLICLTKPLSKQSLINTIDLMAKGKRRISELEKEIETLRASLDTRKEVEKAKGLLMKHFGLSEPEAFKRIQRQSMDKGIPMKEIAKAVILAYDI